MTPAQLESAARELCRIRSINPEQEYSPGLTAWQHCAIKIRRFFEVGTAITAAMEREAAVVAMKMPRKRKAK